MSGIFGSTTIKGTRITDFAQTSADVGSTIPFLYGRAPVKGNVIFAALPPKENRQVKRQGKGGVKQETFTYTTSYAIAFCRGPIQGYWWIKRNGKVVYSQDPAAPIEDKDYAAKWAAKVMMYNGTSSQMPSSMIEAIKGTGRVSAFRYLAYIAVPDEDVTDGGGAIPSYEAVPIASPAEVWITSTPYAQVFYDNARAGLAPTGGELVRLLYDATMQSDEARTGLAPTGGALFEVPPPQFNDEATVAFGPTGGELKTPPPQQFFDAARAGFAPSGGSLAVPPLGTMQKDEVVVGFGPTGGELKSLDVVGVVSLLHFDGADGSTTFTDATGKVWTAGGNARISTAQSKFGGSSAYFDGSEDWIQSPYSLDWATGSDPFTVELWVKTPGNGVYDQLCGQRDAGGTGKTPWGITRDSSNNRLLISYANGTSFTSTPGTANIFDDQWHHIALVRDGASYKQYVDGVLDAQLTLTPANYSFYASSDVFSIGRHGAYDGQYFKGYIDEFRFTKGVAVYTENFTPPTAPFTYP